jgi:phage gpG-like protein
MDATWSYNFDGVRDLSSVMLRDDWVRNGLQIAGDRLLDSFQRRFDAEGIPPWMGLANSTEKIRAADGNTGPMLYVTGALRQSLVHGELGNVFELTNTSVTVGTEAEIQQHGGERRMVPYAAYHQYGVPNEEVGIGPNIGHPLLRFHSEDRTVMFEREEVLMPARPFIVMTDEDAEEAEDVIISVFAYAMEKWEI